MLEDGSEDREVLWKGLNEWAGVEKEMEVEMCNSGLHKNIGRSRRAWMV